MKRSLSLLALPLLLAGCGNAVSLPVHDTSLQDELNNPLYAEYYYDDLTQQMVNLALRKDPILNKPGIRDIAVRTRTRSLEHSAVAMKAEEAGTKGIFLSDAELVQGEALLLGNVLYFGPTFNAAPGPKAKVYLTTEIDPRDGTFPDDSAVDLGAVKNHYGAQAFAIPEQVEASGTGKTLRTVVIWDDDLGMLYGFAQLSKAVPQQ